MRTFCFVILLLASYSLKANEYHVSKKGNDQNIGTMQFPFLTINKAAQIALAGDIITVHEGTYREYVNPIHSGESDQRRIVYRAAPNEKVFLKGSEIVSSWEKVNKYKGVWKAKIDNQIFGNYNPYIDVVYGDWFDNYKRDHHTGEVYLNEKSLYEVTKLEDVYTPKENERAIDKEGAKYTWYCEQEDGYTILYANFHEVNPNKELVEINVRKTCFYPQKEHINYLTISGFNISQAATQWAAPTAEQIGMVSTHWNKGWIIENNVISNSKCSGITLGKERNTGNNVWSADRSKDGSVHYIEVTFKTIKNGWNKDQVGSHIVRNNVIFSCEQAGICGSMGGAYSLIENNYIYNIWEKRQFKGAEIGGIKLHAAVDTKIIHNRVNNCLKGIWLDWMAQGTLIDANLLYNNVEEDLFFEVDHGPYLITNNILGSEVGIRDWSQGGAFVHNLILGKIVVKPQARFTPYFLPHSTEISGISNILGGDNRYFNNIFVLPTDTAANQIGLTGYKGMKLPMYIDYNIYYGKKTSNIQDKTFFEDANFNPNAQIVEDKDDVILNITLEGLGKFKTKLVDTEELGNAKLPNQRFENINGEAMAISQDYFGIDRHRTPTCGPIEYLHNGSNHIKIWNQSIHK